jgi:hypothetical protein
MQMKLPDLLLVLRAMQRPKYDHMRVPPGGADDSYDRATRQPHNSREMHG